MHEVRRRRNIHFSVTMMMIPSLTNVIRHVLSLLPSLSFVMTGTFVSIIGIL